jgi:hypothetical protein
MAKDEVGPLDHLNEVDAPDVIHSNVQNHIQKQKADDLESVDLTHFKPALENKNTSPETLKDIYSHYKDSHMGESADNYPPKLTELFNHANVPVEAAKDYIAHAISGGKGINDEMLQAAAKHKDIDTGYLEDTARQKLQSLTGQEKIGGYNGDKFAPDHFNVRPEFVHQALIELPGFEPESGNIPQEALDRNNKGRIMSRWAYNALASSTHHTPETLDQTIEHFAKPLYGNLSETNVESAIGKLAERDDLSDNQRAKLFEVYKNQHNSHSANGNYWRNEGYKGGGSTLVEKSKDPAFLSSVANGQSDESFDNAAQTAAIKNPSLPKETVDALVEKGAGMDKYERRQLHSKLLDNPSLTPEHISSMIAQGSEDAVKHHAAKEEDINSYLDSATGSSKEKAEKVLVREKIPESSLIRMINHKNQDVSVDALKHPSVTKAVIDAALKRKAPRVKEAAMLHPISIRENLSENIAQGKVGLNRIFSNKKDANINNADISPEDRKALWSNFEKEHKEKKYNLGDDKDKDQLVAIHNFSKMEGLDPKLKVKAQDHILGAVKELALRDDSRHSDYNASSAASSAFKQLLRDNHDKSIDAWLKNQKSFHQHNDTDTYEKLSADNQKKVLDKVISYPKDSEGNEGRNAVRSVYENLVGGYKGSTSKLDLESTQKLLTNNSLLDSFQEGAFGERYHGRDGFQVGKIIKNLPDDQKGQALDSMMATGHQGAFGAIVKSDDVPKEHWEKAFLSLSPENAGYMLEKTRAMRNNPNSDNFIKDLANGVHRQVYGDHSGDIREKAIQNVFREVGANSNSYGRREKTYGPKVTQDILNNAMLNGEQDGLDPERVALDFVAANNNHMIPSDVFSNDDVANQSLIRNAMPKSKYLADTLKGMYAHDQLYGNEAQKDITPQAYLVNLEKVKADVSSFADPEDQDGQAKAYLNLIAHGVFSKQDPETKKANDFLANVQASPEMTEQVRAKAFEQGLLSPEVSAQLSKEDPLIFANNYSRMSTGEQSDKLDMIMIQGQAVHPEIAKALARSVTARTLDRGNRYGKMPEEKLTAYKEKSARLIDIVSKSGEKDITNLAYRLVTDKNFVKADKKAITKHMFETVMQSPNFDLKEKQEFVTEFAKELPSEFVPKSVIANQAKEVQKSGDFEAIVQLAMDENAPASVFTQASKMVPAIVNSNQLFSANMLLTHDSVSPSGLDKLSKSILKRAKELSIESGDESIYSTVKHDINNKLIKNFRTGSVPQEQQNKQKVISNRINESYAEALQSNDPAEIKMATGNMLSLLSRDNGSSEVSANIFKTLPDVLPEDTSNIPDMMGSEFYKNPQNISLGEKGWKLSLLSKGFEYIPEKYAETVFDRIMTESRPEGSLSSEHAEYAINSAMIGANLEPEKLQRTLEGVSDNHIDKLLGDDRILQKHNPVMYGDSIDQERLKTANKTLLPLYAAYASKMNGRATNGFTAAFEKHLSTFSALANQDNKPEHIVQASTAFAKHVLSRMDRFSGSNKAIEGKTTARDIWCGSQVLGAAPQEDQVAFIEKYSQNKDLQMNYEKPRREVVTPEAVYGSWAKNTKLNEQSQIGLFSKDPAALSAYIFGGHGIHKNAISKESFIKVARAAKDEKDSLGRAFFEKVIDMSPEEGAQFYLDHNQTHLYTESTKAFVEKFGKNISDTDTTRIINSFKALEDQNSKDAFVETMISSGAGGQAMAPIVKDNILRSLKNFSTSRDTRDSFAHPSVKFMKESELDEAIDLLDKDKNEKYHGLNALELVKPLIMNHDMPQHFLSKLYKNIKDGKTPMQSGKKEAITAFTRNKNLGINLYKEIFEDTKDEFTPRPGSGDGFHPAFKNPIYGRDLFAAQPVTVPANVKNVEKDKLTTTAHHSVARNRLQSLQQVMPQEGMDWKTLKKVAPKMENWPQVKNLFMSKKGNFVSHEDLLDAMNKSEGAEFHVTYTSWDGIQRHGNGTNLVVQMNTSKKMQEEISKDPQLWDFYLMIQESSNYSGHPVTPHACSWTRVDTSAGEKGWSVEEFQSDFSRRLGGMIKQALAAGGGKSSKYTPEQGEEYGAKIQKAFEGWYEASLNSTIENARKHGVKEIFIHGSGIRSVLSGKGKEDIPDSWFDMYDKHPKSMGFEKCDYSEYPNFDNSTLSSAKSKGHSSHCWRLKLA